MLQTRMLKVLFFDQNALQFEINKNLCISPINQGHLCEIFLKVILNKHWARIKMKLSKLKAT